MVDAASGALQCRAHGVRSSFGDCVPPTYCMFLSGLWYLQIAVFMFCLEFILIISREISVI